MPDQKDVITAAENVLRELVETVLGPIGEDWAAKSGVTPERIDRWRERRDEERKRRTGGKVDEGLLSYSDLTDLQTTVVKNWDQFKPILDDKKAFDVDMDRLITYRTAEMHGRPLLPYEASLAEGIAGNLRNRVTLYRNEKAPGGKEHFPRFEWVRDSLGHEWKRGDSRTVETGVILHPGDCISIETSFWDPDGQPCRTQWSFWVNVNDPHMRDYEGSFEWCVENKDIGERTQIQVSLTSSRPYHRSGSHDDVVWLQYAVLPRSSSGE